jgi:hypothetical protein
MAKFGDLIHHDCRQGQPDDNVNHAAVVDGRECAGDERENK